MKKLFFSVLILLSAVCSIQTKAQVTTPVCQRAYKLPKLDEHSLVKDSAGRKMDYTAWNSLVSTGKYEVRVVVMANGKGSLQLTKLTKAERTQKVAQMPKPEESPYFVTGDLFKNNFKEKDINGNLWDTKRMQGKIIVINFWYVNNTACRMEIPDLNEVAAAYKNDSDVAFISVAMDDRKTIEEFLKTTPFNFTHLENGKKLSDKMGVINHPTSLVIDKTGHVQYHTTGYSAANYYWIGKTIERIKAPVEELMAATK